MSERSLRGAETAGGDVPMWIYLGPIIVVVCAALLFFLLRYFFLRRWPLSSRQQTQSRELEKPSGSSPNAWGDCGPSLPNSALSPRPSTLAESSWKPTGHAQSHITQGSLSHGPTDLSLMRPSDFEAHGIAAADSAPESPWMHSAEVQPCSSDAERGGITKSRQETGEECGTPVLIQRLPPSLQQYRESERSEGQIIEMRKWSEGNTAEEAEAPPSHSQSQRSRACASESAVPRLALHAPPHSPLYSTATHIPVRTATGASLLSIPRRPVSYVHSRNDDTPRYDPPPRFLLESVSGSPVLSPLLPPKPRSILKQSTPASLGVPSERIGTCTASLASPRCSCSAVSQGGRGREREREIMKVTPLKLPAVRATAPSRGGEIPMDAHDWALCSSASRSSACVVPDRSQGPSAASAQPPAEASEEVEGGRLPSTGDGDMDTAALPSLRAETDEKGEVESEGKKEFKDPQIDEDLERSQTEKEIEKDEGGKKQVDCVTGEGENLTTQFDKTCPDERREGEATRGLEGQNRPPDSPGASPRSFAEGAAGVSVGGEVCSGPCCAGGMALGGGNFSLLSAGASAAGERRLSVHWSVSLGTPSSERRSSSSSQIVEVDVEFGGRGEEAAPRPRKRFARSPVAGRRDGGGFGLGFRIDDGEEDEEGSESSLEAWGSSLSSPPVAAEGVGERASDENQEQENEKKETDAVEQSRAPSTFGETETTSRPAELTKHTAPSVGLTGSTKNVILAAPPVPRMSSSSHQPAYNSAAVLPPPPPRCIVSSSSNRPRDRCADQSAEGGLRFGCKESNTADLIAKYWEERKKGLDAYMPTLREEKEAEHEGEGARAGERDTERPE
uniref:Uncharacterized protein n=1 Tax=Chromera velia CCMP2878 TaxID=1169474 RepID=A0A0G4FA29_9ALVE|eukprot:Cvel_15815.t1-p1 / transcript=Cvel_15815.t1 / gene=Cvel_15815 / organism=Chromera_velia_CCMP2878 / gene_product=hypothetical protein / transcript_product=hypothetical protein / location=Cvel_scaffold1188:779-3573(-) / protein_length=845 / sequence_SO=supercontig / SO=protein_coding / is_pseudo=false